MESSQVAQEPARVGVPMAWDPKNPAALLLLASKTSTSPAFGGEKVAAMQYNTIFSHAGVGCNEHEIAALMQLLDAHEAQSKMKPAAKTSWNTIKTLSKAYRSSLRECLCRWEDNLLDLEEAMTDSNNGHDLSVENLELLKTVYAVTHLSEIFLLPPPAEEIAMEYYDDAFHVPGALTADTVRYLRHHHTTNSMQQLDPDVAQELTHSLHPDQVDGGEPYWNLVNSLVKKGNLEQAWAWLSRHSAARRAFDATAQRETMSTLDEYESNLLEQDKEGFEDLRRILLSAPLPGGRDEDDDAGLDGPYLRRTQEEILLEGVEPSAYLIWEISKTTTEGSDFPINYNPRAASMKRQNWQQYIPELESVRRLKRRIPQLEGILSLLSGNLKGVRFESWAEALIAELIYANPIILPNNIQVRAAKLMEKYPRVLYAEMDHVLLSIMQGNAGQVIDLLQSFGGGSGAALPATMVRSSDCYTSCEYGMEKYSLKNSRLPFCVTCMWTQKSCSHILCRLIFSSRLHLVSLPRWALSIAKQLRSLWFDYCCPSPNPKVMPAWLPPLEILLSTTHLGAMWKQKT